MKLINIFTCWWYGHNLYWRLLVLIWVGIFGTAVSLSPAVSCPFAAGVFLIGVLIAEFKFVALFFNDLLSVIQ